MEFDSGIFGCSNCDFAHQFILFSSISNLFLAFRSLGDSIGHHYYVFGCFAAPIEWDSCAGFNCCDNALLGFGADECRCFYDSTIAGLRLGWLLVGGLGNVAMLCHTDTNYRVHCNSKTEMDNGCIGFYACFIGIRIVEDDFKYQAIQNIRL